jgi:hypothetical protein
VGVARETRSDLWREARELVEVADREGTPVGARRALVVLAVAGAGADVKGFEAVARQVLRCFAASAWTRCRSSTPPRRSATRTTRGRRILVTLPREAADDFKSELLSRIDRS